MSIKLLDWTSANTISMTNPTIQTCNNKSSSTLSVDRNSTFMYAYYFCFFSISTLVILMQLTKIGTS